jgi:hypothetical protein
MPAIRKTNQSIMNPRRAALIFVAGIIAMSCSEKSTAHRGKRTTDGREPVHESEAEKDKEERQPDEDKIAEDCVAFVRSTKVVAAPAGSADCPGCPVGGTEVFSFRQMKANSPSCSGDTCTVVVTIRAVFNPGSGERIAGGLTAWIRPEERTAYLNGQTPTGEQMFRVKITYKRRAEGWRAVEFDRAPAQ